MHLLDGAIAQFGPVVDGKEVPDQVVKAISLGKYDATIPLLSGSNSEDGTTFSYAALDKVPLPISFAQVAIDTVFYPHGSRIEPRYKDLKVKDGRWLIGDVLTDYLFRCSTQQFNLATARKGTPTWVYRYSHVFSASFIFKKFGLPEICANYTCHMCELPFVHHNEVHTADLDVSFTPPELKLSDMFVDFWTSFARYGDPNRSGKQPSINWPAFEPTQRRSILLNTASSIENSKDLCEFWDTVKYDHLALVVDEKEM